MEVRKPRLLTRFVRRLEKVSLRDCVAWIFWGKVHGWLGINAEDSSFVRATEKRAQQHGALADSMVAFEVKAVEPEIDRLEKERDRISADIKAHADKVPDDVEPPMVSHETAVILLAVIGVLDAITGFSMLQGIRLGAFWITAAAGLGFTIVFLIWLADAIGGFTRHTFSSALAKRIVWSLLLSCVLLAIAAVAVLRA